MKRLRYISERKFREYANNWFNDALVKILHDRSPVEMNVLNEIRELKDNMNGLETRIDWLELKIADILKKIKNYAK